MKPQDWTEDNWRSLVNTVRAGRSLTPATWPGGARCALALSFDCDHETFEMGGEAAPSVVWAGASLAAAWVCRAS